MSGEAPEPREAQPLSEPTAAVQPPPSGTNDSAPHALGHVYAHHSAIQFRFLEQLRHRNVIRVGILYLVVCWLILDPIHVLFHMLDVPVWANRLVVILMAVGFPAVLLFAWVYEITPEGLKPTAEVDPHRSIRQQTGQRLNRAIVVVLVLAVAYLLMDKFWLSKHVTAVEHEAATSSPATTLAAAVVNKKSIAVLPFIDMSEKKDQEYFADGMAEEIIDLLARVPDLHVPARTSSFYFKGKSTKVPDIARELGVAYVLEGSIRRSGNQIRVTAQLVRADNGFHLWSQTYDRDLQDIFKVQDEIANAVVEALQIGLMGGPLRREAGGTQNLEAYQLYLKATSAALHNTRASLAAASGYLEQAIKLDPHFGLGWARLGNIVMQQTDGSYLLPKVGYERVRQLAQHALKLSPDLAEAHALLAYVHRTYDWNFARSEAELRAALSSEPTNLLALTFGGMLANTLGRWDDATRQLRAVIERDPMSTYARFSLAFALYNAGRYAEAEAEYRKLIDIEPGYSWAHLYLAKTLLANGKPDAALAMAQQEPEEFNRLDVLSIMLQAAGRQSEADAALRALIDKYSDTEAFFVAMTYAYRGDRDLALQWLDRAYTQKDASLVEIVGEPLFKNLAHDPRFKAFLSKMNLPE